MKKLAYLLVITCLLTTACDDYLVVKPKLQIGEPEFFETQEGFIDAINGCYTLLRANDLYGQKLSYYEIEFLAQHWRFNKQIPGIESSLSTYDFTTPSAVSEIGKIYLKLYNVIYNANTILKQIEDKKDLFKGKLKYELIKGGFSPTGLLSF